MFEPFQRRRDTRGQYRFALSLVLALGGLFGVYGAASAFFARFETHSVEEELPDEDTTMVEFAPAEQEELEPPEPESTPEPEPLAVFRPAAVRPTIQTPDEIPEERPEESSDQLQDEAPVGPTGGDLRGRPGGTGTTRGESAAPAPPPPPPPPPSMRPERREVQASEERVRPGRPRFTCPDTPRIRAEGVAGVVLAHVQVDEQGRLRRFDLLRGHPLLQEAARECLRRNWQAFEPATRADGQPLAWAWRLPIQFRARNI